MFRRTAVFAGLAAIALALSACAPSAPAQPSPSATGPSATGSPVADGELVVGLVLEPDNLDIRHTSGAALEQILVDNIYQGLVTRDEENKIIPALATDYTVSPDGLTYTFTLNEGVVFHGGQPLTSADVVASYTTVKTDATVIGNREFANVATVTAPDASTVVITLTEPDINFLFTLTTPAGLVFSAADTTTDLKTAANGTGPFLFDSWKRKDSITFKRNDAYWSDAAQLAEVTFVYIPDFTAGVNAATTGDLDVLTAVDPNLAVNFDGTDFVITTGKTTDKATLAFNNKKAPLDNVKVREALRMAINHEAVITAVGSGVEQFGPIPELDPGYEDLSDVVSYDPEGAKKLLEEAGVKDLQLTLTIPSFYGTTVTKQLVSDFNAIGVTLKIENVEFPTWLNDVYTNHDYDLSFVLHVEPRDFSNWANPDYYFGYDNKKVQQLYADALATTDEAQSEKLLAEAARIVSEDHAADWLYTGATLTAHLPKVTGFPMNSVNSRINLANVAIVE
ncbi:ABC transporter substrate-binding protein [Microbacterium sp. NC79]|uniref:ABC transporter substrate-binding protein n=1 Tax=Microbacterium sp. NC79 TaxID=2851009 RepID=UPI001C2B9D57|nr:ABC transporter substrate-binding protein [Microbacterium sp. NC79]MBV0895336.1 ABC transporter substrate-binding protein [Microbacterium sp. NC79]